MSDISRDKKVENNRPCRIASSHGISEMKDDAEVESSRAILPTSSRLGIYTSASQMSEPEFDAKLGYSLYLNRLYHSPVF